jgi:hypothetical protein
MGDRRPRRTGRRGRGRVMGGSGCISARTGAAGGEISPQPCFCGWWGRAVKSQGDDQGSSVGVQKHALYSCSTKAPFRMLENFGLGAFQLQQWFWVRDLCFAEWRKGKGGNQSVWALSRYAPRRSGPNPDRGSSRGGRRGGRRRTPQRRRRQSRSPASSAARRTAPRPARRGSHRRP